MLSATKSGIVQLIEDDVKGGVRVVVKETEDHHHGHSHNIDDSGGHGHSHGKSH